MAAENEGRKPAFVSMGEDLDFRWDDYIAAIKDDVRIVFLTNPHSPTGRLIANDDIRRVCEAAKTQIVVLDEAYIHFSRTNGGMDLLRKYDNLIVLRTFSKVFGLAGLRVGFGIANEEIIRPMMHLKPTWNMGALQVAGASAALDDDEYVDKTIDAIAKRSDAMCSTRSARSTAILWLGSRRPTSFCFALRTPRSIRRGCQ